MQRVHRTCSHSAFMSNRHTLTEMLPSQLMMSVRNARSHVRETPEHAVGFKHLVGLLARLVHSFTLSCINRHELLAQGHEAKELRLWRHSLSRPWAVQRAAAVGDRIHHKTLRYSVREHGRRVEEGLGHAATAAFVGACARSCISRTLDFATCGLTR